MHIVGSSRELALFCVVAPDLVSMVKPVAFGHLLPHQCSRDIQKWAMEIHINKTKGAGEQGLCRAGAARQDIPQCNWRTDAEAWMFAIPFTGKGDLKVRNVFFSGMSVVSSASLLQNWHSRSRRNTFRRNWGGCVLFASVGFVIKRKGCEAKIAECTPWREKNKTSDKTSTYLASQLSTRISTEKAGWLGKESRENIIDSYFPPLKKMITIIIKMFTNSFIIITQSKILFISLLYGWGYGNTERLKNLPVFVRSEVAELGLESIQSEWTAKLYPLWKQPFFEIKILNCYGPFVQEGLRAAERMQIVLL